MSDITKSDKNFVVVKHHTFGNTAFYDVDCQPFAVYGVFREDDEYTRLPKDIAASVNDGVNSLRNHTAGGRIRFKTDSPFVAIRTQMHNVCKMPHFPFTGSVGFDLYEKKDGQWCYASTFIPPMDIENEYEGIAYFSGRGERELLINMPLYSGVKKIEIGIDAACSVFPAEKYINEKPVVYYGSSITQGGCASRPGNCYQGFISRKFELDYINLGFSGSARGEKSIREYIAGLEMSAFVLDYDHNAESVDQLRQTHFELYSAVRKAHPNIPIVVMSRPKYYLCGDEAQRLEIITQTYEKAVAAGDENVYLVNGRTLMEKAGDEGTVDGCHPNDLGFMSMAAALDGIFEKICCKLR